MQVGYIDSLSSAPFLERLGCRAQVSFTTLPVLASALLNWNKIPVLCNPTSLETVLKREHLWQVAALEEELQRLRQELDAER